jgi:hypothetical protein
MLTISYYLLLAIATVESDNNPLAINEDEQAYGLFQVRQPALDDVNQKLRIQVYGFTLNDCLEPRVAQIVFRTYVSIYATPYRLGRQPTDEDIARIWNGGPMGHRKLTTLPYWEKVKKVLKQYEQFYQFTENRTI